MKKSTNKDQKGYYVVKNSKQLVSIGKILNNSIFLVHKQSIELAVKSLFEYIISTLDNQSYRWKPLKEDYRKKKMSKGLSGKILIATETYRQAIKYKITENSVWVGVPNEIHEPSGLNYNVLARIHEFGVVSRNIPARPLWRPALSWWIREWNSKHKEVKIKNMRQSIKKKIANLGDN